MADPDEFAGRVALVTAAAGRSSGQAVAGRLAAGGARVAVTDIHPGRTEKVAAAIAADYPAATVAGYPLDAVDPGTRSTPSWTPSPGRLARCRSWSTTRRPRAACPR